MKLSRLYLESISHLEEDVRAILLKEAPRTSFVSDIPPEFDILQAGIVDLNFESYHLPKEQRDIFGRAFCALGVAVPNTRYRLRNERGITSVVELATGNEPVLPIGWKRYVIASDRGKLLWLGKDVRPDQLEGWNLTDMIETEDGWKTITRRNL